MEKNKLATRPNKKGKGVWNKGLGFRVRFWGQVLGLKPYTLNPPNKIKRDKKKEEDFIKKRRVIALKVCGLESRP